jgi:hypothetical protein
MVSVRRDFERKYFRTLSSGAELDDGAKCACEVDT